MFPEETLHCVEWAKDIFGNKFALDPQNFNKLMALELDEIDFDIQSEQKGIRKASRMVEKSPKTFKDCIRIARDKFQKYYYNNIL